MTLGQLQDFKRWHVAHRSDHPVELGLCDVVLALWLAGWLSVPVMIVLNGWRYAPASLLAFTAPELYHAMRRQLHRMGLVRCDWLAAIGPRRPR